MKKFFNLQKKFKRTQIALLMLFLFFIIGTLIFTILKELGRYFYLFAGIGLIIYILLLIIAYRFRCKKIKELQDCLNLWIEEEEFTYDISGDSAVKILSESQYTSDKKVEIKDKITGKLDNIPFEKLALEFYNEFLELGLHYDSSYANLYIFRNVVDNEVFKFFTSYDIEFNKTEEMKFTSNYKVKIYSTTFENAKDIHVPYLSFFISFIQGNAYFYVFNEKSFIDVLGLKSEAQFKELFAEEVQKVYESYEIIKELIEGKNEK